MDWLVFHVEPQFFTTWKGVQRCLKHRNSLLRRDRIDGPELAVWDRELARLSHSLTSTGSGPLSTSKAPSLSCWRALSGCPAWVSPTSVAGDGSRIDRKSRV